MERKNKYAIVGSGISGLSCANILKENNCIPLVFEEKRNYGGLISCSLEDGNIFHRVGGHVFNTKNNVVNKWFWSRFDKEKEFVKAKRNAVIFLNQKFINYPIELNLNQLDVDIGRKVINELISLSTQKNNINNQNFQDYLNNNFGKTLCELYFDKYNKKIWNRDLKNIPLSWLKGKLPMINPNEIVMQNIFKSKEDNMVHSDFYYPKNYGSQFIVDRLSEGIQFKRQLINNIFHKSNKIYLNGDNDSFDAIIYTGDVRELVNILDIYIIRELGIENILKDISCLDANSTSTILCECDINPYSWVYLPDKNIKPHRIIMTGNFSKNNNSKNLNKDRISCTIECSGEVKLSNFIDELNMLPFNPKYISYNFSKNSYIIQNDQTRSLIKKLKTKLYKKNIFLCGRFAEWEYYNIDAAIESAMKVCNFAKE